MEVVSLRPPLVYGPGVSANFLRLLHWTAAGHPLPLASARNKRSLLYLDNLIDALLICLRAPVLPSRTYLVSDTETVAMPELIRMLSRELGRPARLLPAPPGMLRSVGHWLGRDAEVERLLGELVLDSGLIVRELGWQPPYGLEQGIAETVRWFKSLRT